MDFVLSAEYAVMAELADAHGSGPCEATHGGSNPFDRTNTLYIGRVFFYDLTQFLEKEKAYRTKRVGENRYNT